MRQTDRILFRTPPGEEDAIRCSQYASVEEIKCSDHRPVLGQFHVRLQMRKIEGESRGAVSSGKTACTIS